MSAKKLNRSTGVNIALFLFLSVFGLFMFLPILYAFISAFKPLDELFIYPPRFFVQRPTMENFSSMFQLTSNLWVPFSRYLFNTVLVSGLGTVIYVYIAALCAYPLAKIKFKGKKVIYGGIIMALLFTPETILIPRYIILSGAGLINTHAAVLFPIWAGSMGVFLLERFMVQFPDEVIESAEIDGAGQFHILNRIILPNMKPALFTAVIFTFNTIWNTVGTDVLYSENLKMLPTVLRTLSAGGITRAGVSSAAAMFMLLPPFIIFILLQSQVIETMAHSGLKS